MSVCLPVGCLDEDGRSEEATDWDSLNWVTIYSTIEAWAFWHLAIYTLMRRDGPSPPLFWRMYNLVQPGLPPAPPGPQPPTS